MPEKYQNTAITHAKDEILAHLREGERILSKENSFNTTNIYVDSIEYRLTEGGEYRYGLEGENWEIHKKK